MTVVGIVLAGGASSRFGSDKLATVLDGRPLLHHALDAVAEVADTLVLVVAPGAPAPPLPPSLVARISVVHDDAAHRGPLAGLAAGLGTLAALEPSVIALVVGGDMPTLVPGVLRLLVDALEADAGLDAVTLESPDPAPMPMAIRPRALATARDVLARDRRSLRALLAEIPAGVVPAAAWRPLDPAAATLRDVDSPGDLALT